MRQLRNNKKIFGSDPVVVKNKFFKDFFRKAKNLKSSKMRIKMPAVRIAQGKLQ